MNQISEETEDSMKSIYGDKWRQALFIHLIIGMGRIIADRIRAIDPRSEQKAQDKEQPDEKPKATTRIEQNPLAYARSKSRRVAEILEYHLHGIPKIVVVFPSLQDSRHIGDLIQATGAQALETLKESEKRKSRTFPEELMRRAWRQTAISIRQGTQIVVRWLYLISGAYDSSDTT